MKKQLKLILIAVFAVFAIDAHAQFGVHAGYVNSVYRTKSGNNTSTDDLNGLNLGLTYNIGLPITGLSIQPGLTYTFLNDSEKETESGIKVVANFTEHYLTVPLDIKYSYAITNKFKIFAFVGPKFAMGLASKMSVEASGNIPNFGSIKGTISYDNYSGKVNVKNMPEEIVGELDDFTSDDGLFKRFDVMLGVGGGVQYRKLSLQVGYDWGLLNRLKDANNGKTKRNQFCVGLGYTF